MSYLGDFLFRPERARTQVSALSGGERNRLLLARLFTRPANVLVLDEPTNDLDIETLELLEALLQDYAGTLFLVSHDRAFLDNVVTQSIAFEGEGGWREYVGGYSDWLRQRSARAGAGAETRKTPLRRPSRRRARFQQNSRSRKRASSKRCPPRSRRWKPSRPTSRARSRIGDLYRDEPERVKALQERYTAIENELMRSLARWEALETRQKQ